MESKPHSDTEKIRLNRFLAQSGLGSRRAVEKIITAGKICINGAVVTDLATRVDPQNDTIEYKGKPVTGRQRLEYYAYHKPRGVIVTAHDPQGRETIYDALKTVSGKSFIGCNYIGRLDRNSEGLLLLTNDGSIIHALTHPRFHIKKVYQVRASRQLTAQEQETMVRAGIQSDDQILKASKIAELPEKKGCWYTVTLHEGKNRQIRRMFEGVGCDVYRLKRITFASIKLGNLKPNTYRELSSQEVKMLRSKGY